MLLCVWVDVFFIFSKAFDTKFYTIDHVYDCDECAQCNAFRSNVKFMGLGLPIGTVSWGSMLSLAQNALMQKAWWVIIIPGVFLIAVVMCITNIGNAIRAHLNQMERTIM